MIVLDCCAAVSIVRKTEEGKALRWFLSEVPGEQIISPTLFYAEIASVFCKYVKAKSLSAKTAMKYLTQALALIDCFVDPAEYYQEAFFESVRLDHSPYDMFYFLLARRNAATLCTLDKTLIKLCKENGVACIHEAT
jgi:predicted nucleic acid-binding protein